MLTSDTIQLSYLLVASDFTVLGFNFKFSNYDNICVNCSCDTVGMFCIVKLCCFVILAIIAIVTIYIAILTSGTEYVAD